MTTSQTNVTFPVIYFLIYRIPGVSESIGVFIVQKEIWVHNTTCDPQMPTGQAHLTCLIEEGVLNDVAEGGLFLSCRLTSEATLC